MGTPERPTSFCFFEKRLLQNRILKCAMGPQSLLPLCAMGSGPGRPWAMGLHYLSGNSKQYDKKNAIS